MKITDFIIFYLIVALPVFFFVEAKAQTTNTFIEINHQHEGAFTVATQDAINILRTNVQPKLQFGYESYKINPANPQPALDTFLQSLALNYGVEDKINADYLSRFVPAFAIVDYDGLLLNVYKKYQGKNGEELDRVWLPKIPFSYSDDEGNVVNFTIDEDIEVYDSAIREWFYGKREEVIRDGEVTVPLLNNAKEFDQVRRTTIVNVLQENLAYYINEHNVYSKALDVTYKFALPLIDKEDWYNTVDDISILAFMQGNPYRYADEVYHEYAFVGARLNKTEQIKAGIVNGERRFWYASCGYSHKATELYSTKKQAAAAGYRELSCLNPTK